MATAKVYVLGVAMGELQTDIIVKYFREQGKLYERAVRELRPRELQTFVLHDAHWMLHAQIQAGRSVEDVYRLRVRQSRNFLRSLLKMTKTPAARGRRRSRAEDSRILPLTKNQ